MPQNDNQYSLVLQPGNRFLDVLASVANATPFQSARVGVAFASELGVNTLERALNKQPPWETAVKQFLVGVDHGSTQPEALRRLAGLPSSEVRVPSFRQVIESQRLYRGTVFHPKMYVLDSRENDLFELILGSANLTAAGLQTNEEAGIHFSMQSPVSTESERIRTDFERWWNRQWKSAAPLNEGLLEEYESQRAEFRKNAPDVFLDEEPSPSELSNAQSLWIESGFLSGGSRNQLELPNGLEAFFGVPIGSAGRHSLSLAKQGRTWKSWFQLWQNQVWRMRLPTAREGVGDYEEMIVCFHKTERPGHFGFDVAAPSTQTARRWTASSRSLGTQRRTQTGVGGRDYGWF